MSGGAPPLTCEVEPVGGDGLIDPEAFVIQSHAVPAAASQIEAAGEWLTRMGDDLLGAMDDIGAAWWRLPGCYDAPEASQVYMLMNPASQSAGEVRAALQTAAVFLTDYAEAVRAEREPLRDLSARATRFRHDVVEGVWVRESQAAGASFWDVLAAGGVLDDLVLVPWYEDGATRNRNQALLEEHAAIAHRINVAAVACAAGINGIVGHLPDGFEAPAVIPQWALASADMPMPWGYPREEDRSWFESVLHAPWRFGHEFGTAIAGLTGYDTLTDERTGAFAGQSWAGLGNGLGSLLVSIVGAPLVISAGRVPEEERAGWMQWLVDRGEVTATAVGGMAAIDYQAGPGNAMFHDWDEDPVAAGSYAALNALSLAAGVGFLSAGRAAAVAARTGAMSARVARITALAGQLGELAIPGSEILTAGGIRLITGLRTAVRLGELDGLTIDPSSFVDDVARVTRGDDASIHPAGAADATPNHLDDPNPRPELSDDLFGGGAPDVDPAAIDSVTDDLAHQLDDPMHHPEDAAPAPHGDAATEAAVHTAHPEPIDIDVPDTIDRDAAVLYRDDVLTDQAAAVAARLGAMDALRDVGFDIEPADLNVGNIDRTIRRLHTDLDRSGLVGTEFDRISDMIDDLGDTARQERSARTARYEATEALGDTGLSDRFESAGAEVLIEPGSVGAGRFDGVAYLPEEHVLLVGEAKGGSSTLGSGRLLDDGSRAAQGSTLYFNEIWRRDPAITQMLTDNPHIAHGIADGTITVRYELVHTAADGTVTVSRLRLDPTYLDLDLPSGMS